ncbi:MAG: inorganic diphosphatase [Myxococcales bacterium]
MASPLHALDPTEDGTLRVVVEVPKGGRVKLKWDHDLGVFTASRYLPAGLSYPFDWGFVPGTKADDGDPLDALILADVPTFPGVVIPCEPLGVLRLEQDSKKGKRQRNDRLIVRPTGASRLGETRDVRELPRALLDELEKFFLDAVFFTPKNAKARGWSGRQAAEKLVTKCARAFRRKK